MVTVWSCSFTQSSLRRSAFEGGVLSQYLAPAMFLVSCGTPLHWTLRLMNINEYIWTCAWSVYRYVLWTCSCLCYSWLCYTWLCVSWTSSSDDSCFSMLYWCYVFCSPCLLDFIFVFTFVFVHCKIKPPRTCIRPHLIHVTPFPRSQLPLSVCVCINTWMRNNGLRNMITQNLTACARTGGDRSSVSACAWIWWAELLKKHWKDMCWIQISTNILQNLEKGWRFWSFIIYTWSKATVSGCNCTISPRGIPTESARAEPSPPFMPSWHRADAEGHWTTSTAIAVLEPTHASLLQDYYIHKYALYPLYRRSLWIISQNIWRITLDTADLWTLIQSPTSVVKSVMLGVPLAVERCCSFLTQQVSNTPQGQGLFPKVYHLGNLSLSISSLWERTSCRLEQSLQTLYLCIARS